MSGSLRQPALAAALAVLAGIAALVLVGEAATIALLLSVVCLAGGLFALSALAADEGRTAVVLTPALFAVLVLFLWEVLTRGFDVPMVLLPAPSAIGAAFWDTLPDLVQDVEQTVLFAAIPGFLTGTALGFMAGAAVDRSPFLQQGLLPLSNFASVIPIVGVAPIMIMWFGFDWQSKAAVVVLITFFPAFVNMVAGLQQASKIERDLMTSYAATYWQTMWKLRLPAALPFLFAALKINASLSLIGAIVAEFFGTPVHGIGFRISAEIGHLALDHVWAAIVVAALVGSLSYALLAMAERAATFWHPSQRPTLRQTGRTRPKS
jgi:NitT/TauT family transport system permease protein